jgi:hypothetical protein
MSARTLILVALGACIAASAANANSSAAPAAASNSCRVLAVGNQGGAGSPGSNFSSVGTAGGVALGAKAFGGLTVNCNNYSDVLTITAPGHTFSTTQLVRCGGPCTSSFCKANESHDADLQPLEGPRSRRHQGGRILAGDSSSGRTRARTRRRRTPLTGRATSTSWQPLLLPARTATPARASAPAPTPRATRSGKQGAGVRFVSV